MSITLTLSVPFRGAGAMQTAATLIELDASAIDAGATIAIAGVAVAAPASACVGNACNATDSTPDGDDIQVTRVGGTNRVRLTLTYFGSFAGGSLCGVPTIGAAGRSFNVELSGFTFANPSNGYRITSLMAPSDASCDIPYVRVPSARPFLSAVSGGPLTRLGRFPLNIVLVLDKSGSMGWTIPGQAAIRWDRLEDAVTLFANTWDVVGAPPPPASVSSEGHADDRLGLVFFDTAATESNLGGVGSFFQQRGGLASPWGATIAGALGSTGPGGWTSIGSGIERARQRLDDVDALTGDTAIVLFTDGEQNRPPCILHQGEAAAAGTCTVAGGVGAGALLTLSGSAIYPAAPNPPILARQVGPRGPIFTIGLGEGGMAASAQLLDEISQETAGAVWLPNNGAALDTAFVDSLVNLLKGGTVSHLARMLETLPAGVATGTPLTVSNDPSLTRAVFALGWEGAGVALDIEIRRPDGTAAVPGWVQRAARSVVAGLDLPPGSQTGNWRVHVVVSDAGSAGPRMSGGSVGYHLTAFGVESRLSFRVSESARIGTGRPIKVIAEVGWDDQGLADLPGGALRAVIERPGENLGNILHDTMTPSVDPGQDQSALAAKIASLVLSANLLERIAPRPVSDSVPLVDVGHGRYEGIFDGVNVGGQYRVRVDFDWSDPRTGSIRRMGFAERQAAVVPAAEHSTVEVRHMSARGVAIMVTPKDRFGNYVGPGYADNIAITVDGKGVDLPSVRDPSLKGIYEIDLTEISAGDDPRIGIRFRDEPLRDAPLSRLEEPVPTVGEGFKWKRILLLLLVLAIALFVLWQVLI